MGSDSSINVSAPYGGKSAFTQLEHNIVAGYLITAGNKYKNVIMCQRYCSAVCFYNIVGYCLNTD